MKFYSIILSILLVACNYNGQNDRMNSKHPISIVYYDSLSQSEIGDFPINRDYYAKLIDVIEKQTPKYIILKFFFTDQTSTDSLLIKALNKYDNILTQAAVVQGGRSINSEVLSPYRIASNKTNFPDYQNAYLPYPGLGEHFSGVGFANIVAEGTNFKEFNLINSMNGNLYPSLPLLILQKIIQAEIRIDPDNVNIGSTTIPINSRGSFSIGLSQPNSLYRTYSFTNVLNNKVENNTFQDNIVIVFIDGIDAPKFLVGNSEPKNVAEILADAINTTLICLD